MLPGPPTVYQSILDHPRARRVRPVVAAARRHRRRRRSRRADPAHARRARRSRPSSPATGSPRRPGIATMCRHDDDPETIATTCGPRDPRHRGAGRRRRRATRSPRGEPGEVVVRGYNVMQGFSTTPRQPRRRSTPTAGCTPATSACSTSAATCASPTARRTCSSSAGSTRTRPRSRTCSATTPAVGQVAVVGVPDERMGEVGLAFVVPRPAPAIDPDELIAWCREQMANYKVPRYVEIVDALPLNASGKVLKYELRARRRSAEARSNSCRNTFPASLRGRSSTIVTPTGIL